MERFFKIITLKFSATSKNDCPRWWKTQVREEKMGDFNAFSYSSVEENTT
jgi:hypothetical protein